MRTDHPVKVTTLIGRDGLDIEVFDASSGVCILKTHLEAEEAMAALGRQAYVRGIATIYGDIDAPLGCNVQVKHEALDFRHISSPHNGEPATKEELAIVRPFEVEGWQSRHSDFRNYHCWVKGKIGWYNVSFTRFVHPNGQPWLPKEQR